MQLKLEIGTKNKSKCTICFFWLFHKSFSPLLWTKTLVHSELLPVIHYYFVILFATYVLIHTIKQIRNVQNSQFYLNYSTFVNTEQNDNDSNVFIKYRIGWENKIKISTCLPSGFPYFWRKWSHFHLTLVISIFNLNM